MLLQILGPHRPSFARIAMANSCQYSDMARGGIQYVEHVDAVDEMNEAAN